MPILYGTEPSFYTRKAWAAMRLLGLPVDDRLKTLAVKAEVEAAVGGYHRFPVVCCEEGDWIVDSTDIGLELSRRHPARSLRPDDPALDWLMLVAEDWLDEWFLRACLAWRPVDAATRAWVARAGALNVLGHPARADSPAGLEEKVARIADATERFFVMAGEVNGVVAESRQQVLAQLEASLAALETILSATPFLAGTRPSLADASLWGYLEAGLLWEPAAKAHVAPRYPAIVAFHGRLKALADAGGDPLGQWDDLATVSRRLEPLLGGDALGFNAFQRANAQALADGTKRLAIDGVDVPARGFTEKSRRKIAAAHAALDAAERDRLMAAVGGWPLVRAYADLPEGE